MTYTAFQSEWRHPIARCPNSTWQNLEEKQTNVGLIFYEKKSEPFCRQVKQLRQVRQVR